jgi:hypothetical protein
VAIFCCGDVVLLFVIFAVRAVVGKSGLAGLLEPGLARLADGRSAALVLVERSDVSDPGVKPDGLPVNLQQVELSAEHGRFGDGQQVRALRHQAW